MRVFRFVVLCVALAAIFATVASAATPTSITVQGKLTDASGTPLPAGAKTFTFRLFNASSAGTQLWPAVGGEVQSITSSTDGLWIGLVGAISPLTDPVFADSVRWLEIDVNGTTLPRVRLVTGPFAFRVASVDGASGGTITSKVSIGPGHTNSGAHGFVAGADNQLSGDYSAIGGGSLNTTASGAATVAGGQQNNATGFASSIAGGASNSASSTYSSVGGGLTNAATGSWSRVDGGMYNTANNEGAVVGGGRFNNARGQYSTVAGGGGQNVTDSNTASGDASQVGGGRSNVASGEGSGVDGGYYSIASGTYSTVGGGRYNFAQGAFSAIAGGGGFNFFSDRNEAVGYGNVIGGGSRNWTRENFATIAGGQYNVANGQYTTVSGGYQCQAAGANSTVSGGYQNGAGENGTVGGGYQNAADLEATVSGGRDNYAYAYGTISGGHGNRASYGATVSGGYFNKATGEHSTISGGGGYNADDSNSAAGSYSFVGGGSRNSSSGPGAVIVGGDSNRSKGQNSTVGGGGFNVAAGGWSTVPGGHACAANGDFSFAAGSYARANHFGSFVWSDRSPIDPSVDTFYSTAANQFLIRAVGGVGIGTTAPQQQLSVAGGMNIDQSNSSFGTIANSLRFGSLSGEAIASERDAGANQYGLDFYTNSIIRMSIKNSNGAVGIGTTAPSDQLHVIGNIRASGCVIGTNLACPSDRRFKSDIETLPGALASVEKLRGVQFKWKTNQFADHQFPEGEQVGLIAQEVREIVPQAVVEQSDGYLAVDYARLVPLLIEAVKEQQKQIESLKREMKKSSQ